MFDRFDEAARVAVANAADVAIGRGARNLEATHLCLGAMLADDALVTLLGTDPTAVASTGDDKPTDGEVRYGPDALAVLNDLAVRHAEVTPRDLLVASLDHGGAGALDELGIDESDARRKLGTS